MKKTLSLLFLLIFFGINSAYSFWIWTPESKRWINPKYAAKDSPGEQLAFAKSFLETKDYKKAMVEFDKLIKRYPKAREAAEAQYYLGLSLEGLNKSYDAYLAYQKLIEKYPFSERIEEAAEKQYNIADAFMQGKSKFLGLDFPTSRYAIDVFDAVIKNSPYGKYAAVSQYKIGLILKSLARFGEAKDEFEKVVLNYPESEWAEAAKFQIAICTKETSLDVPYDQETTKEAKQKFEEFVKAHPEAELSKEAQVEAAALKEKEAQSNFETGKFYEKQKKYNSAKIYYEYVFNNFPKTIWAGRAFERYQVLEREKND